MEARNVIDALRASPCGRRLLDAAEGSGGVFLVGGAVRDILLERTPHELDVAVEGDVSELLDRLGGEAIEHDRFGTATVNVDGCRYDLARTRVERYAFPGALPDVEPAGIAEDLARRDVTVNAIAVAMPGGEVVAADGALEDLGDRVLRVLHDESLRDDPTRIWRIARYAARLGFAVDPATARLAAQARAGAVSGERMGHELRLALAEPDPFAVFEQLDAISPQVLPEGFTPRPAAAAPALEILPADGRADLVALAAATGGMDVVLLQRWLDHLQFTARDRDVVAAASRWVTGAPLRAATTPAEIARAAAGAPIEAIALAGGDNARRWIDELRHVRLEIDGNDLLSAGVPEGPEIGDRLRAALEAKLDGRAAGRQAELAAALDRGQSPA